MGADQPIDLREYQEATDYEEFCQWWDSHGVVCAEKSDLDSGIGLVAEEDGKAVGACFLYVTGSIGFIEAMVTPPYSTIRKSRMAADLLFKSLKEKAESMGVSKLIAFVASKGMVKECQRAGFQQVGPVMAQMVQPI